MNKRKYFLILIIFIFFSNPLFGDRILIKAKVYNEIVLKYVRDMSEEIPNAEVYVISKEFITKYSLGINLSSDTHFFIN